MLAALRWVEPDIGIDDHVRVGVAWGERACAAHERCVK